jgi:hypothetical protein
LLRNFRLVKAANACEHVAANPAHGGPIVKPREWWRALGTVARGYRATIYRVRVSGTRALDEWLEVALPDAPEVNEERARIARESRRWLTEVLGGRAYVAWLGAYVAVAERDGGRALRELASCTAIIREFVDHERAEEPISVYGLLQSTANELPLFLPLDRHPLSDMQRFALLPEPLRSGYGYGDAVAVQPHHRPRDPGAHPA